MIKILLDTNMLIYREDHSVVDNNVLELTKILYDSNRYRIVIHPMTFDDVNNIKNKEEKKIIYSKLQIYNIIDKPTQATTDFNLLVGCSKIPNDLIDNNLLYAVYKDCVSYLITNDKKLRNKAQKIGIADRVLGIEEAISKFKPLEEKEIRTPVFILHEYLYNIELNDIFFDSLKEDYNGFEIWYKKKSRDGAKAYITRDNFGNLGSFLMLKVEDETEDYSQFEIENLRVFVQLVSRSRWEISDRRSLACSSGLPERSLRSRTPSARPSCSAMRSSLRPSTTCRRVAVIVAMPSERRSLRLRASSAILADPVCSWSLSYSRPTFASGQ